MTAGMKLDYSNKVVWITGASSGIGRELALSFANDGAIVAASARSKDKLDAIAQLSPNIHAFPLDVTDAEAASRVTGEIARALGPVDLAILNAGIFPPMTVSRYDADKVRASNAINYLGVVNSLEPVMAAMVARKAGHIAIVSSVAGFRGLPKGVAYAPTKAALISLAESLYPDLKLKGVRMTIINPGYVATPMTEPVTFPMPFIIPVDQAVAEIRNGIASGRFEIVFPWRMKWLMKTMRVLPYGAFFYLMGLIAKREPPP